MPPIHPRAVVRRLVPLGFVALLVSPVALGAQAGPTGRVEGRVRIGRALDRRRPSFRIYSDLGAGGGAARRKDESQLHNVVLYLEDVPRGAMRARGAERPVVEQRDERFAPHVLAVPAGTTVAFPNADPIFHNVFSLSGAKTFDLGRYPRGASKSVAFDRAGVVQVFCHIHNDMSAVVLVLDTPAYTSPDESGRYVLEGVPPGEYTLVAWHERATPIRRRVRVDAGGAATVDVDIPVVDDERR